MQCPKCGCTEDKVIDSRSLPGDTIIRRRRQCLQCDARFTTHETILFNEIRVIKRDGRREEFNLEKLIGGLTIACQKRPITTDAIHSIADAVFADLQKENVTEVTSEHIGSLVMARLRSLDDVAYVRFASVYWRFDDLSQFVKAVKEIDIHSRKTRETL